MFEKFPIHRLVLWISLVPCLAQAAEPASLPPLSATQVVEKNAVARGGLAAWRAVQTMIWKGKMGAGATTYVTESPKRALETKTRPEVQLPFTMQFKRPLKTRLELEFDGQTAVQVYDGQKGWKYRPYLGRKNWDPYSADELKKAAAETSIDGFLIDSAAKGTRVESDGVDNVEGRAAYKLKVTLKGGQARRVWVDGQSFFEIKVEGEPRRLDGKPHRVEVYLRDYKRENGLMIPHVIETAVQGVDAKEKITTDSVTINPKLDDSRFTKAT
jgi:outer membrane lipoprotein-sorting protein